GPPEACLNPHKLLQAVVEPGLSGVERAFGVHPAAVDGGRELARLLALLAPAADEGAVGLANLDAALADEMEQAVGVRHELVGVIQAGAHADELAKHGEDLP